MARRDAGRRARGHGRRRPRASRHVRRLSSARRRHRPRRHDVLRGDHAAAARPRRRAGPRQERRRRAGRLLRGRHAASARCPAAGWPRASGVKATVLAGLTLMSVSGLAFAFGSSVVVVDLARFMQGVGGACTWAGGHGVGGRRGAARAPRRGRSAGSLGAAIFGVQLGPVVGALATAIGREAAFSTTVLFGLVLGAWALTMPARGGLGGPHRARPRRCASARCSRACGSRRCRRPPSA